MNDFTRLCVKMFKGLKQINPPGALKFNNFKQRIIYYFGINILRFVEFRLGKLMALLYNKQRKLWKKFYEAGLEE